MYQKTQLEEFNEVLGKEGATARKMKSLVFGFEITKKSMSKKHWVECFVIWNWGYIIKETFPFWSILSVVYNGIIR